MDNISYEISNHTIRICVDDYRSRIMSGRVSIPYLQTEYTFSGAMEFLKKTNSMLERMKFPQSFLHNEMRRLQPERKEKADDKTKPLGGKQATFLLRVVFQEHASWQGTIAWMEGNREESFCSVLEMLMLMDSALTQVSDQMARA